MCWENITILVTKHIKDALAKHRAEIVFVRAESQISCAALGAIIVCRVKTNDIRVGIHHDLFIFFCFSCLTNWYNEKYVLVAVFFKGKNFSLQLNRYFYPFSLTLLLYMCIPQVGGFTYFLKQTSQYTHFLANVLNNLSDIQILHFNIDVM